MYVLRRGQLEDRRRRPFGRCDHLHLPLRMPDCATPLAGPGVLMYFFLRVPSLDLCNPGPGVWGRVCSDLVRLDKANDTLQIHTHDESTRRIFCLFVITYRGGSVLQRLTLATTIVAELHNCSKENPKTRKSVCFLLLGLSPPRQQPTTGQGPCQRYTHEICFISNVLRSTARAF